DLRGSSLSRLSSCTGKRGRDILATAQLPGLRMEMILSRWKLPAGLLSDTRTEPRWGAWRYGETDYCHSSPASDSIWQSITMPGWTATYQTGGVMTVAMSTVDGRHGQPRF